MLGAISLPWLQLLAQGSSLPNDVPPNVPLSPALILVLCVVAGIGTVLLLPSRREASMRKIGGVILLAALLIFGLMLVRFAAGPADAGTSDGLGVYFWIFSAIALFGAIRVVTHPRPVYSALYFVLTVFASAGLFLLLWAEFMAAALILIYAGAILVTYVFVIMLASEATPTAGGLAKLGDYDTVSRDPMIAAMVGFATMGVMLFVIFDKAQALAAPLPSAAQYAPETTPSQAVTNGSVGAPIVSGQTQELGVFLFEHHLINVELAGLLLTISMVGAIVIARRKVIGDSATLRAGQPTRSVMTAPMTPINDNPHSIPVTGTLDARQKAYPET
jgi:NADH-quinone oxidoreductase subunit J